MKKLISVVLSLFLLPAFFLNLPVAESSLVNFETPTYTVGNINGQDGWMKTGPYDAEVVANTYGYETFGGQSLRISNAVTSGSFGDQTFSKPLTEEAGETNAESDGPDGRTRSNYFEADWHFASAVPTSEQPGLSVVASPDRGDGARMSWVQMMDTPTGLEVNFYDYQTSVGDFVFTNVVSGLDRTVPHIVKVTMEFVDGPANDVVKVYVDGVLEHTGTSWEDYFRDVEGNETRTVDSVLFRVSGTAAPATLGNGLLIDNLSLTTTAPTTEVDAPVVLSPANGAEVTSEELVKVDWSDVTGDMGPYTYHYQVFSDAAYTNLIYSSDWLTESEIGTPNTPVGSYYVQVMAQDSEGNMSAWSNDAENPYLITVVEDDTTPEPDGPTTKDECKNGGWKTFTDPTFRNQGQCIAYVNSL